MSRGKNLQEMEVGTKQSKTAVNAGARAGDPISKLTTGIPDGQTDTWEDLGGPTPDNYTNDPEGPAKLKDPAARLSTVSNVVNKRARKADPMPHLKSGVKESSEDDEEYEVEYDEEDESEVVSEESEDEDEDEDLSKKFPRKKSKKGAKENEDEDEDPEDESVKEQFQQIESQIEEDVQALLSNEELSEEFKFKAKTVFEAALNARTEQIEEAIICKYEIQLQEEILEVAEVLEQRIDAYLEYVAEEWISENELAIEQGLRSQMTESFLVNLKNLFEDHYVTIPEERYNVLEDMVGKLDDMETKLNEQIKTNVALNKRLAESVTNVILGEISEGLALSQKDKLASLAENVEFDGEAEYREKLVALKESYFQGKTGTHRNTQDYLVEDTSIEYNAPPSGTMGIYLNALERISKK